MLIRLGSRAIAVEREGGDVTYVSHAHSDHAVRTGDILSSRETYALLTAGRGKLGRKWNAPSWIGPNIEGTDGVRLFNAGHMLGATQLMVDNGKKMVFTGDVRLRDGFTTTAAPILQCDILYIDSTFSEPCFTFPDRHDISRQILDWVSERQKRGSVVFGAYRLGKAQELIKLLNEGGITPLVEPSIERYCQIYESFGVRLDRICIGRDYCNHVPLGQFVSDDGDGNTDEKVEAMTATATANDGGNFVAVYPFHQVKNRIVSLSALKAATGYSFDVIYPALVTGWAMKYGFGMTAFPLSDHAGFDEIVRYAKESGASKVVCMYASSGEIVRELRRQGMNARLAV